jgi:hypothetical protein
MVTGGHRRLASACLPPRFRPDRRWRGCTGGPASPGARTPPLARLGAAPVEQHSKSATTLSSGGCGAARADGHLCSSLHPLLCASGRGLSPALEPRSDQQRRPCDGGGGLGGCTRPTSSPCLLSDDGGRLCGGGWRPLPLLWQLEVLRPCRGAPPAEELLQCPADGGDGPAESTKKSHLRAPGGLFHDVPLPPVGEQPPRELSMEPPNLDKGRRRGVGFGGQGAITRAWGCHAGSDLLVDLGRRPVQRRQPRLFGLGERDSPVDSRKDGELVDWDARGCFCKFAGIPTG